MGTLLLRLAAPLQSWGSDSKFDTRRTGREPTKSGVIGLLAAALGLSRDADSEIENLSKLRFGVRVEQEGTLLRDFHMVHKDERTTYLTNRYYLSDATFLVGLESDDESLLMELDKALQRPAFPLFLGRRSCPPTLPITLGIRPHDLQNTLYTEPWRISNQQKKYWLSWHKDEAPELRIITDGEPEKPTIARQRDIPLSFNPNNRQYHYRTIAETGFVSPPWPEPMTNSTNHDPMQELR